MQLQERFQHLLDISTYFDIIAPVNKDSLTTGNTLMIPVITLNKGEALKKKLSHRTKPNNTHT